MSLKMKELPSSERPYEKLEIYGEENLSNLELLAIIIKNGTKEESALALAQKVLDLGNNCSKIDITFLDELSIQELTQIKGIGKVKAIQLKAVCELAKRIGKPIYAKKIVIKGSQDVANLFMKELASTKREIAKLLILNNKNVVIKIKNISFGGQNFVMIDPKDIFTEVIKMQAQRIILIHNHPSGDPTPSKEDIILTNRINEASMLLGISFLDHVIIGNNNYESVFSIMRKKGLF